MSDAEIYQRIFKDSMPELYTEETIDWDIYYRSYVDTYLQRDNRDLAQVADEMQFYNFMTIVAAHTSKPVVYHELAADLLPIDDKNWYVPVWLI